MAGNPPTHTLLLADSSNPARPRFSEVGVLFRKRSGKNGFAISLNPGVVLDWRDFRNGDLSLYALERDNYTTRRPNNPPEPNPPYLPTGGSYGYDDDGTPPF